MSKVPPIKPRKSVSRKNSLNLYKKLRERNEWGTPETAYVYITLHGKYEFKYNEIPEEIPKELRGLRTESHFEPAVTVNLKDIGINTLIWMRAVPGAVSNFASTLDVNNYYEKYKEMVTKNDINIPLYTHTHKSPTNEDFLDTRSRHDEIFSYTAENDKEIINKDFHVSLKEIDNNANAGNKDYKIWLMNNDEDITKKVLYPYEDFYGGDLINLLEFLFKRGFKHVVLVDLSCSAVMSNMSLIEGLKTSRLARMLAKVANTLGGKKNKNRRITRKKKRRRNQVKTRKNTSSNY